MEASGATGLYAWRDGWLMEQGFRVLRFWNNQVLSQTEGVLMRIFEGL
ncbi:MAG: DUF559 domain-containing protein [Candidatus Competibacteraceae bacterium]